MWLYVFQVLDAIVVFASFGLDVAFVCIPTEKGSAHMAALFIILMRLCKFRDIVRSKLLFKFIVI